MMIANAKPLQLTLDNQTGYLFESETREVIVFVPAECVSTGNTGELIIDVPAYFSSGWADRSVQFSDLGSDLERAFPNHEHPVTSDSDPRVKALLLRLRHAYLTKVGW